MQAVIEEDAIDRANTIRKFFGIANHLNPSYKPDVTLTLRKRPAVVKFSIDFNNNLTKEACTKISLSFYNKVIKPLIDKPATFSNSDAMRKTASKSFNPNNSREHRVDIRDHQPDRRRQTETYTQKLVYVGRIYGKHPARQRHCS
jgi:hypothetical protein